MRDGLHPPGIRLVFQKVSAVKDLHLQIITVFNKKVKAFVADNTKDQFEELLRYDKSRYKRDPIRSRDYSNQVRKKNTKDVKDFE